MHISLISMAVNRGNSSTMRIAYIDGMRGLAAIIVIFAHVIAAFYPILHPLIVVNPMTLEYLTNQPILIKSIIFTPVTIFYNGFFAVMIFLILSGYVISYNCVYNTDENYIASSIIRRYFRLTLPILVICLISYSLIKFNLFSNVEAAMLSQSPWFAYYYHCDANFLEMLKFVFFGEYWGNSIEDVICFNTVLWMMFVLLLESYLVYAFYAVFGKVGKKIRVLLYIALIIIFYKSLYLAIILGMILYEIDINNLFRNTKGIVLLVILLLGIYLSSFTRYDFPLYSILDIDLIKDSLESYISLVYFYNILGAFLVLFVFLKSSFSKKIFSKKLPLYLGKISFSIYLLHFMVISSLSSYVYIWLRNSVNASYSLSFFITFAFTIIVTISLSHVFYKYVELRSLNISKSLYEFINR